MNPAHIHLILNHLPIIGLPLTLLFLIDGMRTKNLPVQKFSLLVLFGLAIMTVPVFLTGEPAEKIVKHLPSVIQSFIESHEDAANFSLILTSLTGFIAFISLWFQKNNAKRRFMNTTTIIIAIMASLSLFYTANLGGKIRHTELQSGKLVQPGEEYTVPDQNDY